MIRVIGFFNVSVLGLVARRQQAASTPPNHKHKSLKTVYRARSQINYSLGSTYRVILSLALIYCWSTWGCTPYPEATFCDS